MNRRITSRASQHYSQVFDQGLLASNLAGEAQRNASGSTFSSLEHIKEPHLEHAELNINNDFHGDANSQAIDFAYQSSRLEKLSLLAATLVPLAVSIWLLVVTTQDRRYSNGAILPFITNNRATTQIIVSILAATLACLNVYTASKLLNFATRIYLMNRPLSLNAIKFIGAVSTGHWVSSLPTLMSMASLGTVLLFAIPAILWTGALTPTTTTAVAAEADALKIPQYSQNSNSTWSNSNRIGGEACASMTNNLGTFSACPAQTIYSSVLRRAAQATSNQIRTHAKNDNSFYSYVGRSYGVGSTVGLVDQHLYGGENGSNLLAYTFTEAGYLPHIDCFHNVSMDWHLEEIQPGKQGNGIPFIDYATGKFPNAGPTDPNPDFYAVIGMDGDKSMVGLGAKRYNNRSVILIAAGLNYISLNRTQCEVVLTPTIFNISVDVSNKLITVDPANSTNVTIFDPTSGLAATAVNQVNALGMMTSSVFVSELGDTFMANINASIFSNRSTTSASDLLTLYNSTAAFSALSDSLTSVLDDLLVFIGSSQIFVADNSKGDFSLVDVMLTIRAVRFGEIKYVVPIFVICVLLLALLAVEALRTRSWAYLPMWDLTDPTCLILASAVAGNDVLEQICEGTRYGTGSGRVVWLGSGSGNSISMGGGRSHILKQGTRDLPGNMRFQLGKKEIQMRSYKSEWERQHSIRETEVRLVAVTFQSSTEAKEGRT